MFESAPILLTGAQAKERLHDESMGRDCADNLQSSNSDEKVTLEIESESNRDNGSNMIARQPTPQQWNVF